MTTTTATERYSMTLAPSGLALVHDLLNTIGVGGRRDLLAEVASAQGWIDGAVSRWAAASDRPIPAVTLTERDLTRLRTLRAQLQHAVRDGPATSGLAGSLDLAMAPDGEVTVVPRGTGARWVTSAVLAECFLAQRDDSWRRLKLCRKVACSTAFFDRSRNNSGVWHDVHMCGNAANLQASRARRREATGS